MLMTYGPLVSLFGPGNKIEDKKDLSPYQVRFIDEIFILQEFLLKESFVFSKPNKTLAFFEKKICYRNKV